MNNKNNNKETKTVIDDTFVEEIKEMAKSEDALEKTLADLSGPQILEIGVRLGIPISKTGRVASKRAQLQTSLRSGEIWRGISGQPSTHNP